MPRIDPLPMRRRELMALSAGALASAALYACGADEDDPATSAAAESRTTPDCVLTPEQEEGPFTSTWRGSGGTSPRTGPACRCRWH